LNLTNDRDIIFLALLVNHFLTNTSLISKELTIVFIVQFFGEKPMFSRRYFRASFALTAALFLAGAVFLLANFAPANVGSIQGVVVNTADSKPLSGVTVMIDGKSSTKTNAQGAYTLTSLPIGAYTMRFTLSGYKSVVMQNIRVEKDSINRINAWLSLGKDEQTNPFAETAKPEEKFIDIGKARNEAAPSVSSEMSSPNTVSDHLRKDDMFGNGMSSNAVRRAASGMLGQMKMSTMPHGYTPQPVQRESENFNTEEYAHQNDNEFATVAQNPLSTFSIDVDNAAYSNTRRFLTMQQFPPKDAVRSEEFINYFRYDYPQPRTNEPFSVNTEISACPWNTAHKLVHIGLQGKEIPASQLPPTSLVFLIDVSGSMDSPDKLPLLQQAFTLLVRQLRPQDRVAIVVYAGAAGVVLSPTDGNDKAKIIAALEQLHAGGSTAGGEGIKLAYNLANQHFLKNGNNRVILATDGDFNVGTSSEGELTRLIEKERESGVFLTVLGFGMGNYKDSKMEKLADKGNGNYAYIDNLREAQKVLVGQMSGTLYTIAKDVKIQVEFNPAAVQAYRLIGYENRVMAKEDFNNDKKDAGEIGVGHSVTALYEVVPVGTAWQNPSGNANVDPLKYQTPAPKLTSISGEMLTVKIRYKEPDGNVSKLIERAVPNLDTPLQAASHNFKFSAAVAEFAMILRDSPFKANSSYVQVLALARESVGKDVEGYRAEFIRLVETAQMLVSGVTRKD
jgi:Ca-activated chloride channel family protein